MPREPTPTLILLVRHGQTPTTGRILPGRAPGLHLAARGRRQAEAVAARLARLPRVAAVYASPMERARETAAAIAGARRLAVRVEPGLNDIDPGEWTGARLSQLRRKPEWAIVQHHPSGFRFPRGESFVELQARLAATLDRLVARHAGETFVAVSHADPIRIALAHALGLSLDFFQRIAIAPGSVSAIAYWPNGRAPVVVAINAAGENLALPGGK
jgi:probable phosphomutase (TIGR03848 family)